MQRAQLPGLSSTNTWSTRACRMQTLGHGGRRLANDSGCLGLLEALYFFILVTTICDRYNLSEVSETQRD